MPRYIVQMSIRNRPRGSAVALMELYPLFGHGGITRRMMGRDFELDLSQNSNLRFRRAVDGLGLASPGHNGSRVSLVSVHIRSERQLR